MPSPFTSTAGRPSISASPEPVAVAGIGTVAVALKPPGNAGSGTAFALKSIRIGCAGEPVVGVAEPLPVLVKSGRVENATSTASEAEEFWNGPLAALMSYGALPLVGSTTRIVTVGSWPGAVSTTFSTSYANFSAAACSGMRCAACTLSTPESDPWHDVQVSSVAAMPPWFSPVAKFTSSWQELQVVRFTVKRQLLACGVSASLSSWQVVQLRLSCG